MADTAAIALREITADEVRIDRILIGSRIERNTAARTTQTAV